MRHPLDLEDDILAFRAGTDGRCMSRRAFAAGLAALGLSPAVARLTPANAAEPDLVMVNWGGEAIAAFRQAYVQPFTATHPGQGVRIDGSGPTSGKIRAMVEARNTSWDVCDRTFHGSLELGRAGLLEEVDYSVVDRGKALPGFANQWGVSNYTFSYVLTWDTRAFRGRTPRSWADLWNTREFPGTRALRRDVTSTLEVALLADGVPPESLYPLDLPRAFAKLRQIKDQTIFWSSNADSEKLMRDRECTIGCLPHTRAALVKRDTRGAVDFTFDRAILFVSGWMVPKGNPAGRRIWDFVASTQAPAVQVELLRLMGNGPTNPAADALIPAELQANNPSSAENLRRSVAANVEWYADHYAAALNRFVDTVLA